MGAGRAENGLRTRLSAPPAPALPFCFLGRLQGTQRDQQLLGSNEGLHGGGGWEGKVDDLGHGDSGDRSERGGASTAPAGGSRATRAGSPPLPRPRPEEPQGPSRLLLTSSTRSRAGPEHPPRTIHSAPNAGARAVPGRGRQGKQDAGSASTSRGSATRRRRRASTRTGKNERARRSYGEGTGSEGLRRWHLRATNSRHVD